MSMETYVYVKATLPPPSAAAFVTDGQDAVIDVSHDLTDREVSDALLAQRTLSQATHEDGGTTHIETPLYETGVRALARAASLSEDSQFRETVRQIASSLSAPQKGNLYEIEAQLHPTLHTVLTSLTSSHGSETDSLAVLGRVLTNATLDTGRLMQGDGKVCYHVVGVVNESELQELRDYAATDCPRTAQRAVHTLTNDSASPVSTATP